MSAEISTPLGRAKLEDGKWSAEDKQLEDFLNLVANPEELGYSPNSELLAATTAVDEIPGSKVESYDKVESEPGVIY